MKAKKKKIEGAELEKLNILFVIPQLEKGGSETLVYNVASLLDRKLFNVSLAFFHFYGNEFFRKAFQDQGIRLYQIPHNGTKKFISMAMITRIIRDKQIHIVNAHHFFSMIYSFYACKIAHRRKLVYTEHSSLELDQIPFKWRLLGRLVLGQSDTAIGISDDVTQMLKEKFKMGSGNCITISNGVDIEYGEIIRDVGAIRDQFALADKIKIVTAVANYRKVKNHLLLLQAFRELLKEFRNVRLLLVGQANANDSENSEGEVRRYIEENNMVQEVILTGHRSDVRDLLAVTDVFCLTSFQEGLPISLLEAMSSGLPVVGTNVKGIRDVIVDGKNGFLVPLGDPIALKDSLRKILNNESLKRSFGRESRKIIQDSYSINACVNRYQSLFMSLMKR
jgi:glycosyltransferase involved in cell wall biosynthesis